MMKPDLFDTFESPLDCFHNIESLINNNEIAMFSAHVLWVDVVKCTY